MELGPHHCLDIGQTLHGVPVQRTSRDTKVSSGDLADCLLLGLNAAGCVVLNGRAPGDLAGGFTCFTNGGRSVVDYGIVSATLYSQVQWFQVLEWEEELISKDHAALALHVRVQGRPAVAAAAPGGSRCPRTMRPRGERSSAYTNALCDHTDTFRSITQQLGQGLVTASDALSQVSSLVARCARTVCSAARRGLRAPGVHAPWFDSACMAKRDALRDALTARRSCPDGDERLPAVQAALLAARRAYRSVLHSARSAFEQQEQIQLINTYFSNMQRDYWRVFSSVRPPVCPITDVDEWTRHFVSIMGQQPQPQVLSSADAAVRLALFSACREDPSEFDCLNDPYTVEEIADVMASLPAGKAADSQGLTCELLKAPAQDLNEDRPSKDGPPPPPMYACGPFVVCVAAILQRMLSGGGDANQGQQLPPAMRVSKLGPVPKQHAQSAPGDKDMYRGISVASVFTRVIDRIKQRRLDREVERLGVRAPTQCGFRQGHGCLDALFTMHHLINKARWQRRRLWVVFVDFSKAFDKVRRDVLIERCRELGVHGPFLDSLVMLYDEVVMKVVVNGTVGAPFHTYLGTKQGSELSPLLFGLFMDLLHELIKMRVPGAGPVVGNMSVPNIMYADDVTLMDFDPAVVQQLLDCLSLFCTLFDMEVNMAPHKTCVVVFRRPGCRVPARVVLTYRGQPVCVQPSYKYLGVLLHETRGISEAADTLACSGRRALHALLPLLRQHHLTQFDMRCRMFDVLVEPVMSYAAHIWGPRLCAKWLLPRSDGQSSGPDTVHFWFLRWVYGVGKSACKEVLLKDTHRLPMPFRWLLLAASWWEKSQGMADSRLARQAWLADVELMLSGCDMCWSYELLRALESIGFVQAAQWRPGQPSASAASVCALPITKDGVMVALRKLQRDRWAAQVGPNPNPRSGPSQGTIIRTHDAWVHRLSEGVSQTRRNAPPHMKLCLPLSKLQCLARYRTGGLHLEGRRHNSEHGARGLRHCKLCSQPRGRRQWSDRMVARCGAYHDEDLFHFMMECPAYDHIREHHPALFPTGYLVSAESSGALRSLFAHDDQESLAQCVWDMDAYRSHLLGLCRTGLRVCHQPPSYIPADSSLRCRRDMSSHHAVGHVTGATGWTRVAALVLIIVYAVALYLAWLNMVV